MGGDVDEVEVEVTHLEIKQPPARPPIVLPAGVSVVHAKKPPLRFYRFLYDAVGNDWLWVDRKKLSDRELAAIIHDDRVEVHVLWVDGSPAGYAELDLRSPPDIELAYFGLMPEYFGRGLGKLFLGWTIDEAFRRNTPRFWVHTCTLDHPAALPNYQRCGFAITKKERILQPL
jgi:GNAT superfamily N-acetyltransferase